MNTPLRFILASLTAAIAAMVLLWLLLMASFMFGDGTEPPSAKDLFETLYLLPIVIIIGGIFALPAAALAGGILVLVQRQRRALLPLWIWLAAGLAAGGMVGLVFSIGNEPQEWLIILPMFGLSAMAGAWTFRRIWGSARI